ncbi:TPA: hypothetical protein ACJJ1B_005017 [Enterobacter roggenkampii]|uniref:hypothetical protein n=1 Tax=Enterobacter roggenkampii TaxID=1812935 RepID=UPI000B3BA180|nr:hypothetical protein [Enterobacter roggenkampii]OUR38857.1 hypothetical protein B9J96_04725 [Enterobacter roggenkampii]HEM7534418.1 hypothetical protein [Enterobacter roggenkampii]
MSTITIERVAGIASGEKCYTHDDVVELARIALASLEAEPVGYFGRFEADDEELIDQCSPSINGAFPLYATPPAPEKADPVAWLWSHRKHPSEVTLVRPEDDERAEGAHWSGWSCQALYAEPPTTVSVPDYPETLPCPVVLEPGMRFGKGVPTRTMPGALQRRAEYYAELEAMTPEQRAEHDAGMNAFASMLQGADGNSPVIPDWQAKAEKMAEIHGRSFVIFRNGESPQCADPTKVIISFTDEGLGHGSAAPQQEAQ